MSSDFYSRSYSISITILVAKRAKVYTYKPYLIDSNATVFILRLEDGAK